MIFGGRWLLTLLQSNIPSLTDNFIVIVVWILKVFLTIANGLFSSSTTRNHVLCDREIEYSWMRGLLSNAGSQKKNSAKSFFWPNRNRCFSFKFLAGNADYVKWHCMKWLFQVQTSTILPFHRFIRFSSKSTTSSLIEMFWFDSSMCAQVPNVSASLCFSSAHLYFIYLYFREK